MARLVDMLSAHAPEVDFTSYNTLSSKWPNASVPYTYTGASASSSSSSMPIFTSFAPEPPTFMIASGMTAEKEQCLV